MNKLKPFIIAALLYSGQPTMAGQADLEKVLENINNICVLLESFLADPKNQKRTVFGHYGYFDRYSDCKKEVTEIGNALKNVSRIDIKQYLEKNDPKSLGKIFPALVYNVYSLTILDSTWNDFFYESLSKYEAIADFFTKPEYKANRDQVINARKNDPENPKMDERQAAINGVARMQESLKPVHQQLSDFAKKSQLTVKKGKADINQYGKPIRVPVDTYAPPAQPTETKPQSTIFTTPKVLNVSSKKITIKIGTEAQTLQQGEAWQKTLTLAPGASAQLTVECEGFTPITIDLKKLPSGTLYLALDAGRLLFGSKTPQSSKIDFKPMSKADAQKQYPKWVK